MFSNLFSFYSADGTFVPSQKKNDIIENFTEENVPFKIQHKSGKFLMRTSTSSQGILAYEINSAQSAGNLSFTDSFRNGSMFKLRNNIIYLQPNNGFFILENDKVTEVTQLPKSANEVDIILAESDSDLVLVHVPAGTTDFSSTESYSVVSEPEGDNLKFVGKQQPLTVHTRHPDAPSEEIVELKLKETLDGQEVIQYIDVDTGKVIKTGTDTSGGNLISYNQALHNESKGFRFKIELLDRYSHRFILKLVNNNNNDFVTVDDKGVEKAVILLKNEGNLLLVANDPEIVLDIPSLGLTTLGVLISQYGHFEILEHDQQSLIRNKNRSDHREAMAFTPEPEPISASEPVPAPEPAPEPAPGQCDYSNYILSSEHESIINEVNAQHQILLDEASLKCPVGHFCMTKAEWDEFLTHERRQPFQDALNDLSLIDGDAN